MLQLLGHYSRVPCDSETVRHLHKLHGLSHCTMANVQQHAQQASPPNKAHQATSKYVCCWWKQANGRVTYLDMVKCAVSAQSVPASKACQVLLTQLRHRADTAISRMDTCWCTFMMQPVVKP